MKPRSLLNHSCHGLIAVVIASGSFFGGWNHAQAAPTGSGETAHFWYRLAPQDGPYIDTQRGSQAFGLGDGKILLSEDNARTWQHEASFPNAKNINFSCILGNGNIVFATRAKLYLSTDKLKTVREIVVKDRDGRDYVPPTPKDPNKAGLYFYSLDGVNTFAVGGKEMLIWGNYGNVGTEPVPANVYYSIDGGETVKIAYAFGQNPKHQSPGTDPASRLGAPDNPVICRHVHSVSYNPAENAFYASTGDNSSVHGRQECHWLRGTYDALVDRWDWRVVVSSEANSRFKSGGINFSDGQICWVADANGPKAPHETYDRGIFRCAPADLAHPEKHLKIFDARYELAVMTIEDDVILVPEYGNANPCDTGFIISTDRGKTWWQYDLKEFGDRSGTRVNKRNSDGWFRIDLRAKWVNRAEVLFIKPKPRS
jgi:hypothetical protein